MILRGSDARKRAGMATTDEVERLLPAYVAGELEAPARARVERVLALSPLLRREVRRYRHLFALLAAAAREDPGPDTTFTRRLWHRLGRRRA